MDYIQHSIDLIKSDKCADHGSLKISISILNERKKQLTPLVKECDKKGISLTGICPEIWREWEEINFLIKRTEIIEGAKETIDKYERLPSTLFTSGIIKNAKEQINELLCHDQHKSGSKNKYVKV